MKVPASLPEMTATARIITKDRNLLSYCNFKELQNCKKRLVIIRYRIYRLADLVIRPVGLKVYLLFFFASQIDSMALPNSYHYSK